MDETLTTREVAQLLGVHDETIRRMIDGGVIHAIRLTDTGWRRIERSELERYAQSVGIHLDWSKLQK